MDAKFVAIGNSRGVRLPKPFIEEAGLAERVSLRAGWAAAARLARERYDSSVEEAWSPTGFDTSEWEWKSTEDDA